ncbi:MAG TPA: alpha-amylase family glycosyl hydrolase, partial [Ignavibacteriaceae bacterium]|nr:alpha-amylase family glycosyl hydrolase [Ignavibacteriaceae bacterium]
MRSRLVVLIIPVLFINSYSQSILLHTHDAKVWTQEQTINGELNGFFNSEGTLLLNGSPIPFSVSSSDSSFSVELIVGEGENEIYIQVDDNGNPVNSDTIHYTLGYELKPDPYAYAEVDGNNVTLHGTILSNPSGSSLNYEWQADVNNPENVSLSGINDTLSTFSLTPSSPIGEYYFNLYVYTSDGDTVKARTFVTNYADSIVPFHIKNDYASWIDTAVIYEISPYNFVVNGNFNDVTNKIDDIARLGINTIWIQPVMKTHGGGQGYDIIDYFGIRNDYGNSQDLHNLVQTAKSYGIKVIFDFVPNHSSKYHPYAQNSITYGEDSHYYNFYQRTFDSAAYSQYYNLDPDGFIYYFWEELINLNFNNPEVQKWITEALKFWLVNFDIDGYRFDAVWGVNARNPEFMKNARLALKRIKPEFLMLAEDKATWPS